jgi:hypothetical protein
MQWLLYINWNNYHVLIAGHVPKVERQILNHATLSEELNNSSYGPNKMKHLLQNSSLLGHAEKSGLLQGNTAFIEFGAGRGTYVAWTQKKLLINHIFRLSNKVMFSVSVHKCLWQWIAWTVSENQEAQLSFLCCFLFNPYEVNTSNNVW